MDCIQGMLEIPDKYIDLAIVDPPYGIKADKGVGGFGVSNARHYTAKWDNEIPDETYFKELYRVSKNYIIFGAQYMTDYLTPNKKWLVWDKVGEMNVNNPYSKAELAATSFEGVVDKFTYYQAGFISKDKSERIHPTQKPVALYKWLLQNYANPGDLILDTHVGSASSLIACEELGFSYIGFELDPDYYKASCERLETFRKQIRFNFKEGDYATN